MTIAETLCLALNRVFPKRAVAGRESLEAYAEAEYEWARAGLAMYGEHARLAGARVLDAGCGLGGKSVFYAEHGAREVLGVDRDPAYVAQAIRFGTRSGSPARFVVGSLAALPCPSDHFDLVFLDDVVEHIERPILEAALAECRRVIKPGGRICIAFSPWDAHDAGHLYDYVYTPWCHLIFSEQTLVNVTERQAPRPTHGGLSVVDVFRQLNRLTADGFAELVRRFEFRVVALRPRMIRDLQALAYVPIARKYLTSRVVAVLSK